MPSIRSILASALFATASIGAYAYHRRIVRDLSVHKGFGVLTCEAGRRALAQVSGPVDVVFCDLDNLHHLNAALGSYARVDALVRAAFGRRGADVVAALRQSGDEFFFLVPAGTGAGLAQRLQAALEAAPLTQNEHALLEARTGGAVRGLSATWAVASTAHSASAALDAAIADVVAQKAARSVVVR